VQTFVEIGSAVRKIFPDKKNKKNKQIENKSSRTANAWR